MQQPVPEITEADVIRLVRRDYDSSREAEVWALLRTYGVEAWEREVLRVQAAILRLADGDVERLRLYLADAKRDYRDVLVGAEYLAYGALELRTPNPSPDDVARAVEADWNAYAAWLYR